MCISKYKIYLYQKSVGSVTSKKKSTRKHCQKIDIFMFEDVKYTE